MYHFVFFVRGEPFFFATNPESSPPWKKIMP